MPLPPIELLNKDELKPANAQLAVDLLPAFDNHIEAAKHSAHFLQKSLQVAYKLSWETKQNVAGIVLLDLLERARILQRELNELATEIERDRSK